MSKNTKTNVASKPAPVAINFAPIAADVTAFLLAKDGLATATDKAISSVKEAMATMKDNGLTLKKALKALRAGLVASGVDKRRVSEALLSLGFRERAATAPKAPDEALDAIVARLLETAKEMAQDKVVAALRRAYLKAQAEANSSASK